MGDIKGSVTVGGKKYPFKLNSMRDHSYGKSSLNIDFIQDIIL